MLKLVRSVFSVLGVDSVARRSWNWRISPCAQLNVLGRLSLLKNLTRNQHEFIGGFDSLKYSADEKLEIISASRTTIVVMQRTLEHLASRAPRLLGTTIS
jgi:hypothetical protein